MPGSVPRGPAGTRRIRICSNHPSGSPWVDGWCRTAATSGNLSISGVTSRISGPRTEGGDAGSTRHRVWCRSLFAKVVGSINAGGVRWCRGLVHRWLHSPRSAVWRGRTLPTFLPTTPSPTGTRGQFLPCTRLAQSGSTLYVGGDLQHHRGAAPLQDRGAGCHHRRATPWDPSANLAVQTLAVSGSVVYAGGNFNTIGGQTRARLAALDATTGPRRAGIRIQPAARAARMRSRSPSAGSTVYVGGAFSTIGFQFRNNIAALDATTGRPLPESERERRNTSTVYALAVSGSVVSCRWWLRRDRRTAARRRRGPSMQRPGRYSLPGIRPPAPALSVL